MTSTDDQRARLSAMRRELVETLTQDGPSPAGRAAVAGIDAALEVLEEMPPAEKMPSPGMLRRRLWQVREDALFGLACYGIEPTRLALAADANAALEATGKPPSWREPGSRFWRLVDNTKVEAAPACRAEVSDDGSKIRLTLHSDADAVASVELDPTRVFALAGRLIDAALPRLSS